jgi:glycosyltransferase involved in cell wall biosynthesis
VVNLQRHSNTSRRFLAAVGDVNDPTTWSGIPYHFLQAAKAEAIFDEGLPLAVEGIERQVRRWIWNAMSVLSGDRLGGYQYSVSFLETLWAPHRERLRGSLVVNCFQLYPPSIVADSSIEKWFFIDQTLLQLFDHYRLRSSVGRRIAKEAVERERDGYHTSTGIIASSSWATRSIIEDYGVPPGRVHVVVPGANLDPEAYAHWEREEERRRAANSSVPDADRPVRFVFVGKDWKRKGLDRLLRGFALARRQECNATLRVIGCPRESLPVALQNVPWVEWCGFIDKRREAERFLHLVAECDVGCLLSWAEAGAIVLREYHALGLAALGTSVGGSPELVCSVASWLLEADVSDEEVATTILTICRNRDDLAAAKTEAWSKRHSFLYIATVRTLTELLGPDRNWASQPRREHRVT